MRALSRRLSENAEAVCRAYLPGGRRSGRYWIVGDVSGARGKSLFVRIAGDGCGYWTDAATAEHGDLLDLIRLNKGFNNFRDTIDEARSFLRDPRPVRAAPAPERVRRRDTSVAARKLFASAGPVAGTLAETYLRGRGITARLDWPSLRFHPACYYRPEDENAPPEIRPALLGAVTALDGTLTGLQRTWLAHDGSGKAPVIEPRRAMGRILGNAVRFGKPDNVMAAGEGIETVLSLLSLFPALPMVAALSAAHLAALLLPPRSGGSMCFATTTPQANLRKNGSANAAARRASTAARSCPPPRISTPIFAPRRSTPCGDECSRRWLPSIAYVSRLTLIRSGSGRRSIRGCPSFAMVSSFHDGPPLGLLRVARMPEPGAGRNGGGPFIFRRGPRKGPWAALHREAK